MLRVSFPMCLGARDVTSILSYVFRSVGEEDVTSILSYVYRSVGAGDVTSSLSCVFRGERCYEYPFLCV